VLHPLTEQRYGKSRIRVMKVARRGDRHELRDMTVDVRLRGDYDPAFVVGDNSLVLPTDTMKNTVYALARERAFDDIETFALALSSHFLDGQEVVSEACIEIAEGLWKRLTVGEKPQGQAFCRSGDEERTTVVRRTRAGVSLESGLRNILVLKSGHSAFGGFPRDKYTTLADTDDRILATSLTASWRYRDEALPFGVLWQGIRQSLLESFAQHDSLSVQHTLYAMAEAVIENHEAVVEVRLSMPNRHHLLVDLSPFGLDNPNVVFMPTTEPYGLIEATVRRRTD
jgi:urate oxidase